MKCNQLILGIVIVFCFHAFSFGSSEQKHQNGADSFQREAADKFYSGKKNTYFVKVLFSGTSEFGLDEFKLDPLKSWDDYGFIELSESGTVSYYEWVAMLRGYEALFFILNKNNLEYKLDEKNMLLSFKNKGNKLVVFKLIKQPSSTISLKSFLEKYYGVNDA